MAKREVLGGLDDASSAKELRRLSRLFRDTFGVSMEQMNALRKNRDVAVVISEAMKAGRMLSPDEVKALGYTEAKARQILDRVKKSGLRPVNPNGFFSELRRSGGPFERLASEVEPLRSEAAARTSRRRQGDMLEQDRIRASQQAARRTPGAPVDDVFRQSGTPGQRGGPLAQREVLPPNQQANLDADRSRQDAGSRESKNRGAAERNRTARGTVGSGPEDVFGRPIPQERGLVRYDPRRQEIPSVTAERRTRRKAEKKRLTDLKKARKMTVLKGAGAATLGGFLATLAFDAIVNGTRRAREASAENAVNLRRAQASPLAAAEFEAEMQSDTLDLMDRTPLGGLQRASAPVAQGLTRELGELMQAEARTLRDFERSAARKMQIGDLI